MNETDGWMDGGGVFSDNVGRWTAPLGIKDWGFEGVFVTGGVGKRSGKKDGLIA